MPYVPILATWGTVQVNDDLDPVVACPCYGFLEVGKLAGDVGLAGADVERPISNGDADMVQSMTRHNIGQHTPEGKNTITCKDTHPAAAIAAKSDSVILQRCRSDVRY